MVFRDELTGELTVRVPGDKSVSQRALILAAMADGQSRIRGLLRSADPIATGRALQALGVAISGMEGTPATEVRVSGAGLRSWQEPAASLDLANSGTGARLLAGALAAQPLAAVVTGDASLSQRPMDRISVPLRRMGASVEYLDRPGRLPFRITGGRLSAITHRTPVASAQVKSAVLLAGAGAGCGAEVIEPRQSRDHTERMLAAMGVPVEESPKDGAWAVRVARPPDRLAPLDLRVPGDFSSAAFFLVWAALCGDVRITVPFVGLSKPRTGLLRVLRRMGARVKISGQKTSGGEPAGDLRTEQTNESGGLRAATAEGDEVSDMIDEVPVLAVLAARAEGITRITGAEELRVKESDRIAALVSNLRTIGVEAEERPDGLEIQGTERLLSGRVRCFGDHRIAMAFGVLAASPGCRIEIDEPAVADVSFPGFWALLDQAKRCRARTEKHRCPETGRQLRAPSPCTVVTVDGLAGSGKSTTAIAAAARLGFRHLDSGALYRAVTLELIRSGRDMTALASVSETELAPMRLRTAWDGSALRVFANDSPVPDERLRSDRVTAHVAQVAALPAVRSHLLGLQRSAATGPGLVADGRDMGTVVFPGAAVKVYLVASAQERARRRLAQGGTRFPSAAEIEAEARRLVRRDDRDSSRDIAPLRCASDAVRIDTTELSPEEQASKIVELVAAAAGRI